MEVHEGGGARLARSSTAKASPAKQKRLFSGGSRKSNKGGNEDGSKREAHTPEPVPVAEEVPLSEGSAKVRRSKTTPSRKPGSGKEGSAPSSGKSSKRNSRRKSSEAGSPLGSPRESTVQLAPLSSVSTTQPSTDPSLAPQGVSNKERETASSSNSSNPEVEESKVKASSNETALPTPPASKLLDPSEKGAVQQEAAKEEVKPA